MTFRARRESQYVKNAAGLYVLEEPISAALVAGASAGDVVSVAADGTLELTTPLGGVGSGATVLYDSGALASAANSIDTGAGGFSGSHDLLEIVLYGRTDESVAWSTIAFTFNSDSGSNYTRQRLSGRNGSASASYANGETSVNPFVAGAICGSNVFGTVHLLIPFYAESTGHKNIHGDHAVLDTSGNSASDHYMWRWASTAAITRVTATAPSGKNLLTGSHMIVYGR
jgi:hypothetical protein